MICMDVFRTNLILENLETFLNIGQVLNIKNTNFDDNFGVREHYISKYF